jgi:hypothetical protein
LVLTLVLGSGRTFVKFLGHKHFKVRQKSMIQMEKNKIVNFGSEKVGHILRKSMFELLPFVYVV